MNNHKLAEIDNTFEQDIKSGVMFFYDIATERVIGGESIEAVRVNESGAVQININGEWLLCDARLKTKLPKHYPQDVIRTSRDGAGIPKRVAFVRDMLRTEGLVLLDMTTGYQIPASMICSVDANGPAVQISLCPSWHMERQGYLCDAFISPVFSDDDSEEQMEERKPPTKFGRAMTNKQKAEG